MLTAYIFVVLTLAFSAFFSGSEIAYISANRLKIELKNQQGSSRGKILAQLYEQPSKFLGTMLIGNNIALVMFGMLTEELWQAPIRAGLPSFLQGEFSVLLALTLVTTVIVLIFGEFFPKLFFQLFAEQILFFSAYILKFFRILLFPFVWLLVRLSEVMLKILFDLKLGKEQHNFTRLDLEHFIIEINDNTAEDIDTQLFKKALYLKKVKVESCMIPLNEVVSVPLNASIEVLKQTFIDSKLSKILVYNGTPDQIIGYVHHQTIFDDPKYIKPILFHINCVNSDTNAYAILNQFTKNRKSIAYVQNKDLQIIGIITLEDILEQIFGDIEDEHD